MLAAAAPAAGGTLSSDPNPAAPDTALWSPRYAAFEVDLSRSPDPERTDESLLRVSGDFEHNPLSAPAARLFADGGAEDAASRLRAFGVAWRHRLDTTSHITFSAGYHRDAMHSFTAPDFADTRASLSLTNRWAGDYRPSLTGSLFVGGEHGSGETYRQLGRRYYGFAVGGELALAGAHRPYLSLQMQRGVTEGDETLSAGLYDDDRSQIAAGWKWQAKPYWSLQAEASYGNNGNRLRWQNPEESRLFFGTRFDFK